MTIQEFVENPDRVKLWREWLGSPLGRDILEVLRTYAAPVPVHGDTSGHKYAEACGIHSGYSALLSLLTRMDVVAENMKARGDMEKIFPGDYGAEEYIKNLQRGIDALAKGDQ